jgi:hypothetical protein
MSRFCQFINLTCFFVLAGAPSGAFAAQSPLDAAIQAAEAQLDPELGSALVMAVGVGMDHHPLEPATPLGIFPGLELGVSVVASKPPSSLGTALSNTFSNLTGSSSNSSFSSITDLVIPSLRFDLHKGIGNWVDLGVSLLPKMGSIPILGSSYFYGADLKICVFKPQEGPTIAVRVSYNVNSFQYQGISLTTTTWTPSLLISRKMGFADPYLGASLQYATGTMSLTIDSSSLLPAYSALIPGVSQLTVSQSGRAIAGNLFGGVSLKIPVVGLRLTLEGAYNTGGMAYLGTKVGLSF